MCSSGPTLAKPIIAGWTANLQKMCRWLVWCSEEAILLADVVLEASNSLLHQSFNAGYHPGLGGKNNMTLNADGFGVGWYGKRGAAIYRSVTPAWNNRNLRELCGSIESQCIFAHVRATTPGSVVSEENCHPFRYGPLLFQHNGHVEGFGRIKRRLLAALRDDVFEWIDGTTDSQACFGLVLSLLHPDAIAEARLTPGELQAAMLGAIAMLREFLQQEQIDTGYSTFNFALTDGQTVVVTRYCDKARAAQADSTACSWPRPRRALRPAHVAGAAHPAAVALLRLPPLRGPAHPSARARRELRRPCVRPRRGAPRRRGRGGRQLARQAGRARGRGGALGGLRGRRVHLRVRAAHALRRAADSLV